MKIQKSLKLIHQAKVDIDKKKMDNINGGVITTTTSDVCYACGIGAILKIQMAINVGLPG